MLYRRGGNLVLQDMWTDTGLATSHIWTVIAIEGNRLKSLVGTGRVILNLWSAELEVQDGTYYQCKEFAYVVIFMQTPGVTPLSATEEKL